MLTSIFKLTLTERTLKSFALIGVGGFVAARHMRAIADTGNKLVAALDKNDSVGVMDSHFPKAEFFLEYERFDRHIDLLRREGQGVDYVSICSPNYLHDSHMRFALRAGADAICEKPLVLNPWNIDGLAELEKDTGKKINTILQLRLHDAVNELKEQINTRKESSKVDVDLTYITSRGKWYLVSWKGDEQRSGGIATNIGVHFFDMLHYVFGTLQENVLHLSTPTAAAGYLEYEHARVRWFLSIDENNLPDAVKAEGLKTYRSLTIGEQEFEFSGGFTDLHTKSYKAIIEGNGYGLDENRVAIETVASIRNQSASPSKGEVHPMVAKLL